MGGNILASTKSSYQELVPQGDPASLAAQVRKLMEDQHKLMMRNVHTGVHDAEIARRTGGAVYEPGVLANGTRAPGLLVGGDGQTPASATPVRAPAPPPASVPTPPPRQAAPAPQPARPAPVAAKAAPPPPARSAAPAAPRTPPPMASSLPKIAARTLATGAPPAPPVMVPTALSMGAPTIPRGPATPPPSSAAHVRPPAPEALHPYGAFASRNLDEVILSYLAMDSEGAGR